MLGLITGGRAGLLADNPLQMSLLERFQVLEDKSFNFLTC